MLDWMTDGTRLTTDLILNEYLFSEGLTDWILYRGMGQRRHIIQVHTYIWHEANDRTHPHSFALDNKEKSSFKRLQKIKKKQSISLLEDITQSPERVSLYSSYVPPCGDWWLVGGIFVIRRVTQIRSGGPWSFVPWFNGLNIILMKWKTVL